MRESRWHEGGMREWARVRSAEDREIPWALSGGTQGAP